MSEQRERLDRLMKKQADGSFKVVGYQFQQLGKIFHGNGHTSGKDILADDFEYIKSPNYIPHDRIDQYTGVDVDGVKVFERDNFITENLYKGVVIFSNGSFVAHIPSQIDYEHPREDTLSHAILFNIKLTGIEGVN